jgi:dTDP-4-amino-4,6-dideoxygalactose transaminase
MTSLSWDRHSGHAWSYDVLTLGYNYRIDEIRSALGTVQLKKLLNNNELRRKLVEYYRHILSASMPDLLIPFKNHPGLSACHLFVVLLPKSVSRSKFIHHLKENGIQTSMHYPPIHTFTFYTNDPFQLKSLDLPITESIAKKEVTLPLYPSMGLEKVEWVCESICKFFKKSTILNPPK